MAEEKNEEWKKTVEGVIGHVQLFLDADSTRNFTPKFMSQMLQCFRDAHNSEVAELRQCLKEAIEREGERNTCYPRCEQKIACRACVVKKWSSVLESVSK